MLGLSGAMARASKPPRSAALLTDGTAKPTTLARAPIIGSFLEFAFTIDRHVKTHLSGDIFARDDLHWKPPDLATVSALAAMSDGSPAQGD